MNARAVYSVAHPLRPPVWPGHPGMVRLLRRVNLNKDWLFERCREVQASPNGHLDLWAREHGKSSIITFGATIQDILKDREITVGIFSHTRPIAKTFLRQRSTEHA